MQLELAFPNRVDPLCELSLEILERDVLGPQGLSLLLDARLFASLERHAPIVRWRCARAGGAPPPEGRSGGAVEAFFRPGTLDDLLPLAEANAGADGPMLVPERLELLVELLDLPDELRITVLHELGHYFGLDEDRLAELGYE